MISYIRLHIYIFSLIYDMPELLWFNFAGCMLYISFKIIV